ncbi:MAG: carbohydrate kinase [Chloroflexi bacterium]|nr:carbohydrate kinase [Chloroflexota bacterium]MBU1750950.1 carbohydrate kinase [Chloroflexota bacterium]MBU1877707.1 carbohydrate kinase [Chloroflexota bacterium]
MSQMFDIAFLGHYTQDTIVYPGSSRTVDGGAFYYGASVAARMGLRVAVVTRLARADRRVLDELERLGVTVYARATPTSTCLRLTYPTANLDERTIELTSSAGPFTVAEVAPVSARTWHIGASVRGEVPAEVIRALAASGVAVSLDVQGFVRAIRDGALVYDDWPGREAILPLVTVLKTDAVEAELLTGQADRHEAARRLAALGPREVLLTHGGGVLVYHDGVFDEAPWRPREVRGRSGRGDTCTAAYLSRRLTASPAEAVAWAAAVTSLKLEAEGPFRRELTEVEALYRVMRSGQTPGVTFDA